MATAASVPYCTSTCNCIVWRANTNQKKDLEISNSKYPHKYTRSFYLKLKLKLHKLYNYIYRIWFFVTAKEGLTSVTAPLYGLTTLGIYLTTYPIYSSTGTSWRWHGLKRAPRSDFDQLTQRAFLSTCWYYITYFYMWLYKE